MPETHYPNRNALWAELIVEELVYAGVAHVCISPGSRSTPLTLAIASRDDLHVHSHIDERSAAFFALGLAKQTGAPVALVCTSGSAGAHYHPAFIEALYARLPLIALTADRPVHLIGTGAGQTITQPGMFGPHVRASLHLELPQLSLQALHHLRTKIGQAARAATGRLGSAPGPVHINVPFEEPLAPVEVPGDIPGALAASRVLSRQRAHSWLAEHAAPGGLSARQLGFFARLCEQHERGVIVCGPHEPAHGEVREPLLALAAATGFPILADPLSPMRSGEGAQRVMTHYDTFLRSRPWASAHAPEVILRFGAQPTSKVYRFWREDHPGAIEVLVDPFGDVLEQTQQASHLVTASPGLFATQLAAQLTAPSAPTHWARELGQAEDLAAAAVSEALELGQREDVLWEGFIARSLALALPEAAMLWAASSMPIRDLDTFACARHTPLSVLSNRGANGIDGLIASAMGAATARPGAHALLIGDIAFLHDASSLLMASRGLDPRLQPDLTVVLVNNSGGGIFEHLPIAKFPEHFERHFITPHAIDFGQLCAGYGVTHQRVERPAALLAALSESFGRPGLRVIEAVVARADNVRRHRALWADITERLQNSTSQGGVP